MNKYKKFWHKSEYEIYNSTEIKWSNITNFIL